MGGYQVTVPHMDELWAAILTHSDKLVKENTNTGNSRESASISVDGRYISTIVELYQHDGTVKVFRITANWNDRQRAPSLKIDRWYHNNEPYWEAQIAGCGKRQQDCVVIEGVHYRLGENGKAPGKWNGFGGRRFDIEFYDGRAVTTYDLWYQGPVPTVFRDRKPDNARWADADG